MMSRVLACLFAVVVMCSFGCASSTPVALDPIPTFTAMRTDHVTVDGKLDEAVWRTAPSYEMAWPVNIYGGLPPREKQVVGDTLREPGRVQFAWDDQYVYIAATLTDSDIVAGKDEDQVHLYREGDVLEVFLKPESDTYYWELYVTPGGRKTHFFFPSRGRLFTAALVEAYQMPDMHVGAQIDGTLNNWHDRDRQWTAEMAVPIASLTEYGAKINPDTVWRVLAARYNYSRYLPLVENSTAPRLSAFNYHLLEDYAYLRFSP